MSTSTLDPPLPNIPRPSARIAGRFVWKEYRTLRGLWLAVALLGMIEQALSALLAAPGTDVPALLFGSALAATTLYAIGAAAILFAVEHEDETYGFLTGLPTKWQPVFFGKLFAAVISAVALAALLVIMGWIIAGWRSRTGTHWPSPNDARLIAGLFGVAICEALAWGTLFSLLVKRPLAAALLTIVLGALATHLAVNAMSASGVASLSLQPYTDAVPLRSAIVAAVFVGSMLVARRWLIANGPRARTPLAPGFAGGLRGAATHVATTLIGGGTRSGDAVLYSRRRLFARLLWQTWCESWKWLLLPFGVAAFLQVGIVAVGGIAAGAKFTGMISGATVFFLPALYGALAFHADQRRGSYRFLAEHAARPRYVWLARHFVWFGALTFFSLVIMLAVSIAAGFFWQSYLQHNLQYSWWMYESPTVIGHRLGRATRFALVGGWITWLGALAAYGIGQLCSMLMRSQILAAFLSLVLAVVLGAWAAVVVLWGLSGWLFMLSIAVGTLAATWLRAPDWIAGRNAPRSWAAPVSLLAATLALIAVWLPVARLQQVPAWKQAEAIEALEPELEHLAAGDTPKARKTADMYLRAADALIVPLENSPLQRWNESAYGGLFGFGGMGPTKIPEDEQEAYQHALEEFTKLQNEARAIAIREGFAASERTNCRFQFDVSLLSPPKPNEYPVLWTIDDHQYGRLDALLNQLLSWGLGREGPCDGPLAALRMSAHLRSGQPTIIYIDQLKTEQDILETIASWVHMERRTNDELRDVLGQLQVQFAVSPDPREALIADRQIIRDVLLDKTPPLMLSGQQMEWSSYLAFLANRLSWERERALRALDIVTRKNTLDTSRLTAILVGKNRDNVYGGRDVALRRWLRPNDTRLPDRWVIELPDEATSFLLREEYQDRVPLHDFYEQLCDTETYRRATLLQIALAMYRRDHEEYPAALAELVPEYLDRELLDPYSRQPFKYAGHGLEAPLRRWAYADYELIESKTPVFWSVGPNNVRLTRREVVYRERTEDDPDAEPVEVRKTLYALVSQEARWYHEPALVFPLPK